MEKKTVTEEDIQKMIVNKDVVTLGRKTTAVVLTLANGFEVVGTSACVCAENYSMEVGEKYAMKRAMDKVWELEGYVLQANRAKELTTEECCGTSCSEGAAPATA